MRNALTTNPKAPADAVVTFSGGQDSTTLLLWALDILPPERVVAISFDYGQRHRVELDRAAEIAADLGVKRVVLDLPALSQLGGAALTSDEVAVAADATGSGNDHAERNGLPSTFVPGRNILFLTLAAAYAAPRAIPNVVTGICEADRSGYPDCRSEFAESLEHTIHLGMGVEPESLSLVAPLLALDKADTWRLADALGRRDYIAEMTHTCYEGDRDGRFEWGYGCGMCPACEERARGYRLAFG